MIRNTRNKIRNRAARNLAIPNVAPAMVVNPSRAATMPITRKTSAMLSIVRNPPCGGVPNAYHTCMTDPFLAAAIEEAERGGAEGGIPIGAVLVHRGAIIGRGHNRRVQQGSATLHGEMDALERAGRQPASVYRTSIMYTTLSPCA